MNFEEDQLGSGGSSQTYTVIQMDGYSGKEAAGELRASDILVKATGPEIVAVLSNQEKQASKLLDTRGYNHGTVSNLSEAEYRSWFDKEIGSYRNGRLIASDD